MDRDEERSFEEPIHTTICGVDVQFRVASVREHRFLPDGDEGHDEMFEDMFSEMHETTSSSILVPTLASTAV